MTTDLRREPVWLEVVEALAIHDRQLSEHGGGSGVRDLALLDSALARPRNRWAYGDNDFALLAASYAFEIARNHPFVDGNKRTAWVIARLFLDLNGGQITFQATDAISVMLALASGEVAETELADWFRTRLIP